MRIYHGSPYIVEHPEEVQRQLLDGLYLRDIILNGVDPSDERLR